MHFRHACGPPWPTAVSPPAASTSGVHQHAHTTQPQRPPWTARRRTRCLTRPSSPSSASGGLFGFAVTLAGTPQAGTPHVEVCVCNRDCKCCCLWGSGCGASPHLPHHATTARQVGRRRAGGDRAEGPRQVGQQQQVPRRRQPAQEDLAACKWVRTGPIWAQAPSLSCICNPYPYPNPNPYPCSLTNRRTVLAPGLAPASCLVLATKDRSPRPAPCVRALTRGLSHPARRRAGWGRGWRGRGAGGWPWAGQPAAPARAQAVHRAQGRAVQPSRGQQRPKVQQVGARSWVVCVVCGWGCGSWWAAWLQHVKDVDMVGPQWQQGPQPSSPPAQPTPPHRGPPHPPTHS